MLCADPRRVLFSTCWISVPFRIKVYLQDDWEQREEAVALTMGRPGPIHHVLAGACAGDLPRRSVLRCSVPIVHEQRDQMASGHWPGIQFYLKAYSTHSALPLGFWPVQKAFPYPLPSFASDNLWHNYRQDLRPLIVKERIFKKLCNVCIATQSGNENLVIFHMCMWF